MGLMHGDVWGEKLKVVVAAPDSKLLWHLSFGANMNPKACPDLTTASVNSAAVAASATLQNPSGRQTLV